MIKTIRHKTNNVIVFAGDDYQLADFGLVTDSFKAPTIKSPEYEIIEVENLPEDWRGGWYSFNGSDWIKTGYWVSSEPSFDKLKSDITAKINAQFAKETAQIKGQVVQEEVDTFPTQEKEALGFTADNTFPAPLLNTLATVRDITVAELAVRVLAHAEAYKHAIGLVMGKKHKLEDQVDTATTIDDLKMIEVK